MPDKERSEGELRMVRLDQIEARDGFNPRTALDQEQLEELTASIRQRGILQPLLLCRTEEGALRLVAGHRRLAAARAAGLRHAPALVRDGGEQLEDAISENVQRHDLNPIDEARALERAVKQGRLSQKALAGRLGKSPAYVRERLRLLRLPDQAQQALAAGELPLSAAPVLERIAKVSADVAEACVALVQAGHAEAHQLEREPARVVAMIERVEWKEGTPVAVATYARKQADELPLGERSDEIKRRYDALPDDGYGYKPGFSLHAEEDAARAYGCLLEFKHDDHYGGQAFICDPEFIADRCLAQLERMEQLARERTERQAKRREQELAAAGLDPHAEDADEKAQAELRRQERERERQEQVAARGANLDLGTKLAGRFHRPRLTKDVARLLALLVFDRDADAYAARGLRYVDPNLQDVEVRELKSGAQREKVGYADRQRCAAYLVGRLDRARCAEEVLGIVLQTLIAAHFADERVTAKSHRIDFTLPGSHGYHYDGIGAALASRREIPALVEKIAKPALPRRMREQLAQRQAERGEAERQTEVVGRDADGVEVTRDEVVASRERLTEKVKQAFEETAGPVQWSAEDE